MMLKKYFLGLGKRKIQQILAGLKVGGQVQYNNNIEIVEISKPIFFKLQQQADKNNQKIKLLISQYQFPKWWSKMSHKDENNIIIQDDVAIGSEEDQKIGISASFNKTLSAKKMKIVKITRIQNKWLWRKFIVVREELGNKQENFLWHGTSNTDPKEIYGKQGGEGFDLTFANAGMWGNGIYFARDASYSGISYAYKMQGNRRLMFFARVITGQQDVRQPDKSFINQPQGDGNIHIIYGANRAYPEYLVEFE